MASQLDDDCRFFIRLDKGHLLRGDILLTDGDSCFHIALSIAAFSRKLEAAEKVVEAMLSE